MSETAKKLFDSLRNVKEAVQAIAPGLKNFGPEVKAELLRQGAHGASEFVTGLQTGNAFVMYGPGQRGFGVQQEHQGIEQSEPSHDHEQASHELEHER
jgi:hypothetical protein